MHSIQSIICFNGGSAGDLLKALCLLGWDLDISKLHENGRIDFDSQYFKFFCENVYKKKSIIDNLDWSKVFPVENSHFYLDCYPNMAKKLYYINYDDSINHVILTEYVKKRHKNSWSNFLNYHVNTIHADLQKYVNTENCQQVFEIYWKKNLRSWRCNANLQPIEFAHLLNRDKILDIIEIITDRKISNITAFDKLYLSWQDNNSRLIELVA